MACQGSAELRGKPLCALAKASGKYRKIISWHAGKWDDTWSRVGGAQEAGNPEQLNTSLGQRLVHQVPPVTVFPGMGFMELLFSRGLHKGAGIE